MNLFFCVFWWRLRLLFMQSLGTALIAFGNICIKAPAAMHVKQKKASVTRSFLLL